MQCSVGKRTEKKRYRVSNGSFGNPPIIQRGLLSVPDFTSKELHCFPFVSYVPMESTMSLGCLPVSNFIEIGKLIEANKFIRLNNMLVRFFGFKHSWDVIMRTTVDKMERVVNVSKTHAFLTSERKLIRIKSLKAGDKLLGDVSGRVFEVVEVRRAGYVAVAEIATTSPNCLYSINGITSGNITAHRKQLSMTSYGMMIFDYKEGVTHILLVQNRYSWAFLDLLRAKYYNQPLPDIARLFVCEMTDVERSLLKSKTFEELWKTMEWPFVDDPEGDSPFSKAQMKFKDLKIIDLLESVSPSEYRFPEIGLPKGRSSGASETPLETAKRETLEETSLRPTDYTLLENTEPVIETFIGTNGVLYKHVYFIAQLTADVGKCTMKEQSDREISLSMWASKQQSLQLLRHYESAKQNAILCGFERFESHVKLIS